MIKRNIKKNKMNPAQYRSTKVADNVQMLEKLVTRDRPYLRSVVRTNNKTPGIILYTDEQIRDLKNLCCSGKSTLVGGRQNFQLV